jgi:putative ABC transport system permease protein
MLRIALLMLFRDKAKYAMLISGLTFCSLLMSQQAGVFCGIMMWTTATLRNISSPVWVVDAKVQQVNEVISLRDIDVQRVRSLPGVAWAVPLFWGIVQARLPDGSFQAVQLTGLDSASFTGRPAVMLEGRVEDLRLPNSVIVDQVALEKLHRKAIDARIGTTFEINDEEARIVGICKTERSFLGQPYVYTTYERALQYMPAQRKMLAYVLAEPKTGVSPQEVVKQVNALPGLRAFDHETFFRETMIWYIKNTGIPVSFGTVVLMGIIVGIAIAGQTFYLFVHDNLRYLAALKAMGAGNGKLIGMVMLQAFSTGFIGYGLGLGLASIFGNAVLRNGTPPFYMPWQVPVFVGVVIALICCVSAAIGVAKVARLEAAMVFK